MDTLLDFHDIKNAYYHGKRGEWFVVLVKTKNVSSLEKSNFAAAIDRLTAISVNMVGNKEDDDWAIETSGHWLLGFMSFLVVRPNTEAFNIGQLIQEELKGYPVLDEELYLDYDLEDRKYLWDSMSIKNRVDLLKNNNESIFAARSNVYDLLNRALMTYEALISQ